jgi:Na+/proline symporter
MAKIFMRDRFRPGNTVRRAKLVTGLWGAASICAGVLAWRLGSILESIVKVNSYFYGCLLGIFLLGALNESAKATGACAGLLISVCVVLACAWLRPEMWVWFGAIGCVVSFVSGYLVSTLDFYELRHRSPQRARN